MHIQNLTIALVILVVCIILVIKVQGLKTSNVSDNRAKIYLQISMYLSWGSLLSIISSSILIKYNLKYLFYVYWFTLGILLFSITMMIMALSKISASSDSSVRSLLYWIIFAILFEIGALSWYSYLYFNKISSYDIVKREVDDEILTEYMQNTGSSKEKAKKFLKSHPEYMEDYRNTKVNESIVSQ